MRQESSSDVAANQTGARDLDWDLLDWDFLNLFTSISHSGQLTGWLEKNEVGGQDNPCLHGH